MKKQMRCIMIKGASTGPLLPARVNVDVDDVDACPGRTCSGYWVWGLARPLARPLCPLVQEDLADASCTMLLRVYIFFSLFDLCGVASDSIFMLAVDQYVQVVSHDSLVYIFGRNSNL